MSIRENLDISAYLVLGPENTLGRPVGDVVAQALDAGFTCVQVRSKVCGARELIACAQEAADAIAAAGAQDRVALLVDDRLDVALAARDAGIKVDGVHVGQSDVPVEVCRKYLGEDAIVGLSARAHEMRAYIETADMSLVDYLGVGPLHETATKPDCGMDDDGRVITRSLEELADLHRVSPKPIVVGGGVKAADIPALAKTGVEGFFVVSAVCSAEDPRAAAAELVDAWRANAS
ncbi:MAG TPA: thiamine phosphate synthase [Candidatus Aveggerthella stercoripullorum]|uniref:Thiamine-phosphate synthase n=1 Tax=Candidatus Aveggerthella stercoripullorum TaxID=2840688 RepID=A0A9D1D3R0_9ACTN|nr:thiamine phosphate synthase [Candidatus Aveggerthella stercoripullorum]